MKEIHEKDYPHLDNMFCQENTVSNVMSASQQSISSKKSPSI